MATVFLPLIFFSAVSFCFFGNAHAEAPEDLLKVEQRLFEQREHASQLDQKEKEAAQELASLQSRLVEATEALSQKQNEQDALLDKLKRLEDSLDAQTKALGALKSRLGSFALALLRYKQQPVEALALRDPFAEDNWHRSLLLGALLPRMERQTESVAQDIERLEQTRQDANEQRHLAVSAGQNLALQRNKLDLLIKARQGALQQTAEEKRAIHRELETLAAEAKDLRQLMEKVSVSVITPKNAAPPPPLSHDLKTPVHGSIIRAFGSKDEFGVKSQGLTLKATAGSFIIAPQGGRVAFVGPFRGYGNIVILQHSGGYHSFLAGFDRIDANVGQNVAAGEPLGTLQAKGGSSGELYFEWRQHGEAVNPSTWKENSPKTPS